MTRVRRSGPPVGSAAPELVASGFALENADAPFLHGGLNLADLAHVLDLLRRDIIPAPAARDLLRLILEAHRTDAEDFPYDPEFGEPYNSRERFFVERLGWIAGWLHAGRPRREAARIALRIHVRDQLLQLAAAVADLVEEITALAGRHVETLMPDQTYLQQAQPSTFGHYVLSFAYPAVRDGRRLLDEFDDVNRSPGGAGCVNGTRLLDDRGFVAAALGFDDVVEHTRDAMWQIDGLIHVLATAASLLSTQSKLAEDLEIWSSSEFDFVDIADAYTRSSILMPQKRNPYSLAIVRGASGVLIGRLTGFLAVAKSPSARSDNLIFAYGEVPRALDLSIRVTPHITRVLCCAHAAGEHGPDGAGTRRGLYPGDGSHRVHRPGVRRRLPQRIRGGRSRRAGSQPPRHPGTGSHRRHDRRGGDGRNRGIVESGRPRSQRRTRPTTDRRLARGDRRRRAAGRGNDDQPVSCGSRRPAHRCGTAP
jgi:argininosuccinate lyase